MILTLALKTDLRIHVVDSNRARVMKLHARLNRAQLLPPQVCTLTARPYSEDLPPYLASLLVCSPIDDDGHFPDETGQWLRLVFRCLRPYGGTACLRTSQSQFETVQKLVKSSVLANASLRYADGFALLTRNGPLPGAGSWTHHYADAGNTTVSTDSRVRLPLGVLWFGGSSHDATLPRHGRPPAPQALDGRIIVEGLDGLRAIDAFTGRVMWDAKLPGLGKFFNTVIHQPGALAVGGNYVTTHDGIYVAIGDLCVRLDPSDGQTMGEYQLPPGTGEKDRPTWGYINVVGDYLIAGAEPARVVGSEGIPGSHANHDFTASHSIAVLNRHSGEVLWQRPAGFAYRHNVIAASANTLFCVDSLSERDLTRLWRRGGKPDGAPQLLALDLATGKPQWATSEDVAGQWLAYSAGHDVLLLSTGGQAVVRRGESGDVLWKGNGSFGNYRPMIKGDTIIAQTTAFNLLTGKPETFLDPISGQPVPWSYTRNGEVGCTNAIACQNLITFRSGAVGYRDM